MRFPLNLFFCSIFVFLFSSCSYQRSSYNVVLKNVHNPVFIQMPRNVIVFDNISPIVYKSLHDYFTQMGYNLSSSDKDSFVLKIKIKSLEPIHKFISPDLLIYNSRVRLELLCKAFDLNNKLLAEKTFYFVSLVCKPKDPVMKTDFANYAYKNLMKRAAPKIEQYFRKYWMVDED